MRSWCFALETEADLFSGKRLSRGGHLFFVENANGEMCGEPGGAEKQNHPEDDLHSDGSGAWCGRRN
jgi:hypothetical protein